MKKTGHTPQTAKNIAMLFLVIFALLAALSNSISSIANKLLVRADGVAALPAGLLLQVVGGAFTLLALLVFRPVFVWAAWGYVLAVVVISLAGFVLISYAFAREDASAAGPILGMKVLVTAVAESALQGHGVGLGVWLGAVLSVLALAFIS
ncbi:MAG: EamA family transporter, partial [bacterium]